MSFFSDFWIFFEPDQKNGAGKGNTILEMIYRVVIPPSHWKIPINPVFFCRVRNH
jgi:hypothetical protein